MPPSIRLPKRGEIWWTNFPADPPDKGKRPVIIVSPDGRNQHPRATSVLVIPLSTSIRRMGVAHMLLRVGETGLAADSAAQVDSISAVRRDTLSEPRPAQRTLTNTKICQLAALARIAMGCV
jgi:mRNA-degrading endonuclease toxin of MazEF toxin-antitoxin module